MPTASLPVIDVGPLLAGGPTSDAGRGVAGELDAACRTHGFFLISGHGIPDDLSARLEAESRAFFAQPDDVKARIAMPLAGAAWRGWFPVGGELTSGVPDRKEGLYFGRDLPVTHPAVRAGVPLHGPNHYPDDPPDLRLTIVEWMAAMEHLGQQVLAALAVGLSLDAHHFRRTLTADPTVLFRIFHYPPPAAGDDLGEWGVAEHTDYGLLTLLLQDDSGGLEVFSEGRWVEAPPIPGTIVCNLGDMLERLTAGAYRSTPHRVRPPERPDRRGRLSFPFFLDPSWDAVADPLPTRPGASGSARERWDGADPLAFDGTYGEYLTAKVAKVFPDLFVGINPRS